MLLGASDYPKVIGTDGNVLPRSQARCPYCRTMYDRGDPAGTLLFTYYPNGQSRYWQHGGSEAHQRVMRAMDHSIAGMLQALPKILGDAKAAQKIQASPVFRALKGVLG